MKLWPNFDEEEINSLPKLREFIKFIVRERKSDRSEFINLPQVFVSGRKVGKVPSASNDVAASDKLNDVNWDADYLYILIDNSGTAEWRRATLGAW